ncbi:restriction endonuclease subunit S [Streptomyces phaeochromogenes]
MSVDEVRELPAGWVWSTLQDLLACEPRAITDGPFGSNLKSAHYTDSGARVLRLQNIGDGNFRDERAYISLEHFETLRTHEAVEGDLLLASLGETLPRVAILPRLDEPAIVKADVIRARLHPEVLAKWVYYALLAPQTRAYASALIKGVGRPRLGMAAMRAIPIPVPPLPEQHRIVDALEEQLSRLEAATRSAAQALLRIDRLKTGVLAADLTSVTAKARLKDVLAEPLINGRSVKTMEGGFPVLRLTAIRGGRIDLSEYKAGAWDAEEAQQFTVLKGDFLIARGNGSIKLVGKGGLVGDVPDAVAFPDTMIRVRAASKSVLSEYLSLVWGTPGVRGQIESKARTTAGIYKVNQQILESVEFPLPSVDEQRVIVERQAGNDSLISVARTSADMALRRGAALKNALLRKAFEGALAPQNLNDESAADVLARITAERAAQPKARRLRKAATKKAPKTPAPRAASRLAPEPTPTPALAVQQEFDL